MGNLNFSLDLPVRNEWSNVELLRTSVQSCFTAVFSDVQGSHDRPTPDPPGLGSYLAP